MKQSGSPASIPVHHLSDFQSNCEALIKFFLLQESVNKEVNSKLLKQLVTVGKTKSSIVSGYLQLYFHSNVTLS